MGFKLEDIKLEEKDLVQEIRGKYDIFQNKYLGNDRTFGLLGELIYSAIDGLCNCNPQCDCNRYCGDNACEINSDPDKIPRNCRHCDHIDGL